MIQAIIGIIGAAAVSLLAFRLHALDKGGAMCAFAAGGIIFSMGGLGPGIALLAFFFSGSFLSSLPSGNRAGPLIRKNELAGGYARNWRQVVANGLVPSLSIVAAKFVPGQSTIFVSMFYGSVAAMCSDSWATEIGTRFGKRIRDVITGRELECGLSGGVSSMGIAASAGGAALIGVISALPLPSISRHSSSFFHYGIFGVVFTAGLLGSLCDSILGSTVQAKYMDPESQEIFETPASTIKGIRPQELVLGYKQITNNVVNFASSGLGALIVGLILDLR